MFENVARGRMSDEMTAIMARIATSNSKRENMDIVGEFGKLIEKVIESEQNTAGLEKQAAGKAISATIKFKADECRGMAAAFRKEFAAAGYVARIIKRPSGKKTFVYEIRYRRNGYHIEVSSTDIHEAKRKFIAAASSENISAHVVDDNVKRGLGYFCDVAKEWLTFKQGKIAESTRKKYVRYCERIIFPAFGLKKTKDIRTADIDRVLKQQESGRVREDLYTVLNSVFKYAHACGQIAHNPMLLVQFEKAARKNRRALTILEQEHFTKSIDKPEFAAYRRELLILYYFGLRPCELQDAHFEGDFLIARNAKRKGGKIEYKKIPVHAQARLKIDVTAPIKAHGTDELNRAFRRVMGDVGGGELTQYCLRHTFATVCQMYVRPDIVDVWLGDSPQRLVGRVYTHFPDEFMAAQMQGVVFGCVNG